MSESVRIMDNYVLATDGGGDSVGASVFARRNNDGSMTIIDVEFLSPAAMKGSKHDA